MIDNGTLEQVRQRIAQMTLILLLILLMVKCDMILHEVQKQ